MEFTAKFNIINGTIGINRSALCEQALVIAQTTEHTDGTVCYEGIATICEEWLENRMATIEKWGDSRISRTIPAQVNFKEYMELTKDFADSLSHGRGLKHQRQDYTLEKLCFVKAPNKTVRDGMVLLQGLLTDDKFVDSVVENSLEKRFAISWIMDDIEKLGIKVQKGEKITRLIVKILRKLVDTLEGDEKAIALKEMDIISQNYSILAEKFKTIKQEKTVYLSVDVRDFLRCSYGESWDSCHALGGCYGAGAIAYALNPRVAIAYVESEKNPNRLEWRQIIYMNDEQTMFVGSRQYKTSNHRYTNAVKDIIAGIYGAKFDMLDYSNTDNVQDLIKENLIKRGSDFAYNDICLYNGIDSHVWAMLPAGASVEDMGKINIQHTHIYCVECGEKMTNLDISDASQVYCNCCNPEKAYCDDCGHYHLEEDMIWVDSVQRYVCDNCVIENYHRCDDCGDYYPVEESVYVANHGTVCCDCLEQGEYAYCEECEEYVKERELTTCHDGEEVCQHCLETWYAYCEYCESYEKRNWVYEKTDKHGQVWNVCYECEDMWKAEHGEEEQE